jgi:hypothetical protein
MHNYAVRYTLLLLSIAFFTQTIVAQSNAKTTQLISATKADTWLATDGLGRAVTTAAQNGSLRKDRYVGIFYFIWQGAHGYDKHAHHNESESVKEKLPSDTLSPYDISKLLAENPDNPKYGPNHAFHHWGEPYFGYYLPNDEWIIRKHGQMLSDAGVDVLILDATNTSIYLPQVTKIAETFRKMRKEGQTTPEFAFIVNSQPEKTVARLFAQLYQKGLFKDLWFNWKGKPLLLCPPEAVTKEIGDFFTIRQSWAWSKKEKWFADGKDKWTWLDHTPQSYGWHEANTQAEQISVAIAEHPVSNIGRSFHDDKQPEVPQSDAGLYFSEQWKRALEVDPEFVFVTGWNEWVAMRFMDGNAKNMMGKPIVKGETYFVDLYNAEYSRDAEPVKGAFNDNYYYQLVDNIRKYKGARTNPIYTSTNKIKIDGKFKDWRKVEAVFKDDKGDTFHRKHAGWGRIKEYTNTTGRNDIIETRITSDAENVYFYAKISEILSPLSTDNFMHLFIKTDTSKAAWEGFNFLVNHQINKNTSWIERFTKTGNWENIAVISIKIHDNEIELAIPKTALDISGNVFSLDFKWTDNIPLGDAMHWLDKGDAAPNARFRYGYNKR